MLLEKLQNHLEYIYEVRSEHRINDFIIQDPQLAAQLDNGHNARDIPEKLLIQQDGEYIDVALYLDSELVTRLERDDPTQTLHDNNIYDFWTALEGISHFLYFTWNATYERAVSLLELELQAEVDKFILAALLLEKQFDGYIPNGLHYHLFQNTSFDERLSDAEFTRYRDANNFAAKFCSYLEKRFLKQGVQHGLMNELRRFYRQNHQHKIHTINTLS